MIITSLYAGLLGLLLCILSVRVISVRRTTGVGLGHGDEIALERRIRAQGNFAEYVPLAIVPIGALELAGQNAIVLHLLGIGLFLGRLLHGWALSFSRKNASARIAGMVLTLVMLSVASVLNLAVYSSRLLDLGWGRGEWGFAGLPEWIPRTGRTGIACGNRNKSVT